MVCLSILTNLANIASLLSLVVLLIWSAVNLFGDENNGDNNNNNNNNWNGNNYNNNNNNWNGNNYNNYNWNGNNNYNNGNWNGENGNRWQNPEGEWEFFDDEKRFALKLVLDLVVLLVGNGMVAARICNAGSGGRFEKINFGSLAGSLFMFANSLVVSFWYLLDLGPREQENDNDGNNNGNQYGQGNYYYMDEEERLQYHQTVIAYVSLSFALIYLVLAFFTYCEGCSLPEADEEDPVTYYRGRNDQMEQANTPRQSARVQKLDSAWTVLSTITILSSIGLLIAAVVALGNGDERLIEESKIYNLIAILVWLTIVSISMYCIGSSVLSPGDSLEEDPQNSDGTIGVGLLTGSIGGYALLLFTIFLLFVNAAADEDEEPGVTLAVTIICFVLSFLHLFFGHHANKYSRSIAGTVLQNKNDAAVRANGGFVEVNHPKRRVVPF